MALVVTPLPSILGTSRPGSIAQHPQLYGLMPRRPPLPPATPTPEHGTSLKYYLFYYLIVEVGVYNSLLYVMAF